MYKVTIINDGEETTIHSPYVNDLKLPNGIIKKQINAIDTFEFSIFMNNRGFGKIKPFRTLVTVKNMKTGLFEFEGRVLRPNKTMENDGLHSESYVCEGELGYLHDSIQKHREFRGSPRDLLSEIISYHNSQVEEYKQFQIGNITVEDPNDYIYVYTSAEKDTFQTIKETLLDRLSGELQIRKENGVRFLDYLKRIGEDKSTEIKIAKNLISMSVDVDPSEIVTRLTPLGARIESEDETATDASQARITIESVNNGIPYIDHEGLKAEFGIQGGSVTWDDVTDPNDLLSKGRDWLANQKTSLNQYKIAALDLRLIGLDIDYLDIGNSYAVINPVMGINECLRIIGKSININEPQNSDLTIGDKFKTLSEYQSDTNESAKKVVELENVVTHQSQRIEQLLFQIDNVNNEVNNVKQIIDSTDLEGLPEAISALEQAVQDLNAALEGIPIYDLATPTSDGLMAAVDKAKLDLLTVTQVLNLDELKAKLDLLTVTQPIDLDQLYQDVQNLKNGN